MRSLEEFLGVGIALELANLRELLRQEAAANSSRMPAGNIPHIIKALDRIEREAQAHYDGLIGKPVQDHHYPTSLEDVLFEFRRADIAAAG